MAGNILESLTSVVETNESESLALTSVEKESIQALLEQSRGREKAFEGELLHAVNEIIMNASEGAEVGKWVELKNSLEDGSFRERVLNGESPLTQSLVLLATEVEMVRHYMETNSMEVLSQEGYESLHRSEVKEQGINEYSVEFVSLEKNGKEAVVEQKDELNKKLEEVQETLNPGFADRVHADWDILQQKHDREQSQFLERFAQEYSEHLTQDIQVEKQVQEARVHQAELQVDTETKVATYLHKRLIDALQKHDLAEDDKDILEEVEALDFESLMDSGGRWREIVGNEISGGSVLLEEMQKSQKSLAEAREKLTDEQSEASRIQESLDILSDVKKSDFENFDDVVMMFEGVETQILEHRLSLQDSEFIQQIESDYLKLHEEQQRERDELPIRLILESLHQEQNE